MRFADWLKSLNVRNKPENFAQYKKRFYKIYGDVLSLLEDEGEAGLVSVVLPVYNGEEYLSFALDSVLAQTYQNFELIIVNDGSTDRSGDIASEYAKNYQKIKYIEFESNRRLPAALNAGFDAARGEYFTWISHDNIILPDFLKIMTSELESSQNAAMVYGNMRIINENGKIIRCHGWFEQPPMSGNVILPDTAEELNDVANNTIGAAFLYRAKAARFIGGYDESRFGIEDYDYWMRMNEIFNIFHTRCKEPLYLYRFHKNSLTYHDAEIGITADRPKLMAFDAERRRHILAGIEHGGVGELKNRIISC